jgi:ABC-type transport system involved in multi-copper enzyme maturation permease subunit
MILSAVFIAAFALLGADAKGFHLLWFHWDFSFAQYLYKQIFSYVVIGIWLTFVSAVLALVSTAGIFPDLISTGAIDLYLSKPMSRPRLFLTKYLSGLLFVTLQVALVAVGGFFLLGIRGGEWKPGLLLAIPLVVCFFSYLFSICVLLGILTRSTIAALLLAVLCWVFFWGVHKTEQVLFKSLAAGEYLDKFYSDQIRSDDARIEQLRPSTRPVDRLNMVDLSEQRTTDQERLDAVSAGLPTQRRMHRIVYLIYTAFPKTTETTDLLDRTLFSNEEIEQASDKTSSFFARNSVNSDQEAQIRASMEGEAAYTMEIRKRSIGWVIGTSLAFEAVMLVLAAWIFCRRDY